MPRACSIDGCESPHEAKGFCHLHYQRNYRTGSPMKAPRRVNRLRDHTCECCGSSYQSRSNNTKFCSMKCQYRSNYLRHREQKLASGREYRKNNREKIKARRKEKYQANRHEISVRNRENYLLNREERVKAAIKYQAEHPEIVALTRSRRRAAVNFKISSSDHRKLLHLYRGCCAYCNVKLGSWGREEANSLQWDHVIPLSRGGTNGVGNLVPSCRNCNLSKNASTVTEWKIRKSSWYIQREIKRLSGGHDFGGEWPGEALDER